MSLSRKTAYEYASTREPQNVTRPGHKVSDYFNDNVFTMAKMEEFLSPSVFASFKETVEQKQKISREVANEIAAAMKKWAMDKGATHYTHWFQPLTGTTAEKHDSFFTTFGGKVMEQFGGTELVQQEPDASSFPSGGIRATFEARGYTAWDPSSPAFIMQIGEGKTLCVPTIFVSYTGDALDFKAPLLKSIAYLNQAAVPVCNYFDRTIKQVDATLGWEQEYFLIDQAFVRARQDLMMTGRTVFGHAPAKGQQLDDHYFGSIPERAYRFMVDLETECHKLGIPVRTRHNEVAPCQFECAPIFEELNIAVDHNSLLMDVMDKVARRHNFRILLHEKPFKGVNGSGKHNNWSMGTDSGKNLLSPGKTPKTNLQFLTFFVNTIKAVADYNEILKTSIVSATNEHRLGANEAPPAIISVFIGTHLTNVLKEIEEKVSGNMDEDAKSDLKISIHNMIPDLLLDNTDRNRTSPFAFTGNKFEIRAVGSTANCAQPMTIMNTIVAKTLTEFSATVDERVKAGEKKDSAILNVLSDYIKAAKHVCFEGDNYSDEWKQEAERRGLDSEADTPKVLDFLISDKSEQLFTEGSIYNPTELHARYEILLETYIMKLQIEARVMGDMALSQIIPAAIQYQTTLTENILKLKEVGVDASAYKYQLDTVNAISEHVNDAKKLIEEMIANRKQANDIESAREKAGAYSDTVKNYFEPIRNHIDKLERLVDDTYWPLPKYREILFS